MTDVRDSGSAPNPQVTSEAVTDPAATDTFVPEPEVPPTPDLSDAELVLVHLTEEEAKTILVAAAKAKAAGSAEAALKAAAEEARKERAAAPLNFVGLDIGKNGSYTYVKLARPPIAPDRTFTMGGVTFEHVEDDADGVWLYRHHG
jgi:hypothetical protein